MTQPTSSALLSGSERQHASFVQVVSWIVAFVVFIVISLGAATHWSEHWETTFGWNPISPVNGILLGLLVLATGAHVARWKKISLGFYASTVLLCLIALSMYGQQITTGGFNSEQLNSYGLNTNPVAGTLTILVALAGIFSWRHRSSRIFTALISSALVATLAMAPAGFYGVGPPLIPEPGNVVNPLPAIALVALAISVAASQRNWPPMSWLLEKTSAIIVIAIVANLLLLPLVFVLSDRLFGESKTSLGLAYTIIVVLVLLETFFGTQYLAYKNQWARFTELVGEAIFITDDNDIIQDVNHQASSLLDTHASSLIGTPLSSWFPRHQRHAASVEVQDWFQAPTLKVYPPGEITLVTAKGRQIPVDMIRQPISSRDEWYSVVTVRDASLLTGLRSENEEIRSLLATANDSSPVGQVLLDTNRHILRSTVAFSELVGYSSPTDIVGLDLLDLISDKDYDTARCSFNDLLSGQMNSVECDIQLKPKNGFHVWGHLVGKRVLHTDGSTVVSLQVLDVTDRVLAQQSEQELIDELAWRSTHDGLTRLPNRQFFMNTVHNALQAAGHEAGAVLYADLDNFKFVNDDYSHDIGDDLLRQLGSRLRSSAPDSATLARMSGDEFALFIPQITSQDDLQSIAQRLIRAVINEPFEVGIGTVFTSLSVGIATANTPMSAEDVVRNADIALHAAKDSGKGQYRFFDAVLESQHQRQTEVAQGLAQALTDNSITAWYQPIVRMHDGKIIGYEALARWVTSGGEITDNSDWITLADEAGLLAPLSERVLVLALTALAELDTDQWIAVNVAGSQITAVTAQRWLTMLEERNIQPHRLVIEVVENAISRAPETIHEAMTLLTQAGVKIIYDDFGSGFTSVITLGRLPITGIKLDRSVTNQLTRGHDGDMHLARAIAQLSEELHLDAIASGVETREQAQLLQDAGWVFGQGHYFAPATPSILGTRFLTN